VTTEAIYLVDHSSTKIAVLNVEAGGDRYHGTICLDWTPPELKQLFAEFEENVEGQMFSLADEIEEKIALIPLRVVFPNGMEAYLDDLQVYPSTKRVSFKIRQAPACARPDGQASTSIAHLSPPAS
jgi:hypothetical protein